MGASVALANQDLELPPPRIICHGWARCQLSASDST